MSLMVVYFAVTNERNVEPNHHVTKLFYVSEVRTHLLKSATRNQSYTTRILSVFPNFNLCYITLYYRLYDIIYL